MCCISLCVSVCLCLYDCLSVCDFACRLLLRLIFSVTSRHAACHLFSLLFMSLVLWLCLFHSAFSHPPLPAPFWMSALNVRLFESSPRPFMSVHLLSPSVFSPPRRCLHNVPSSSLCDFAERGPGSGCHPLPPSQHCPRTPDQRHPAAHRLPALPHQPAAHLHRPAAGGAGARLRKHRALLPGVQRADGPLQGIRVCGIHEEGLGFTGPIWAAGPTDGTLTSSRQNDLFTFKYLEENFCFHSDYY